MDSAFLQVYCPQPVTDRKQRQLVTKDKAHKAISEMLLLVSAVCEAGKIAKSEIQDLIAHSSIR
jgi:hypothetical protein